MKIKIVKKSEPADIGIIDLSKVVAVHNHPIEGLEVFSLLHKMPAKFSDDIYDFYIVEHTMDSLCLNVPTTPKEIAEKFLTNY